MNESRSHLEGARLGAYRVGALLGKGGMGTVYRAVAGEDGPAGPEGTEVAIKVFHGHLVDDGRSYERFEREAEIGRRIRHPHVVATFDVGKAEVDGTLHHFMVMEVIEGQTLRGLIAELGPLPEALLFQIADQALDALEAIHAEGIIHRDLKPENIVITPDHRVLLMDLGIARLLEKGRTLTQAGEFVGSLPYAAPEQFGGGEVGARTDLYAFGVVLFELATAKNPFDTGDVSTLLGQKLSGEMPAPRSVLPDLPAFWNEVVLVATRKEMSDRFASAAELRTILQEGEEGAWWRAQGADATIPSAEAALKRLRLPREAAFVGRDGELAALRGAHARMIRDGGLLLVGGPSGVGKSRLLFEFVQPLVSAQGPLVAAGRCAGTGARSYQPFVEALLDLLEADAHPPTERRAALEERLAELLPDTPGVVPHLAAFLLGGLQPGVESGFTKDALTSGCANVLKALAARRPLVLVLEDLHLAGPETLELLQYLRRGLAGHPLQVVALYSDDELDDGSELHALVARGDGEALPVPPLAPAATDDLVRSVVRHPRTVRSLARPLHKKSDGNPLIVLEVLAHLRETGRLVDTPDGLLFEGALDEVALPSSLQDVVGLKLSRLDEEQRETLEAAAVLGHAFEASLLAAVLEERRIKLLKRLAGLERNHILRSSGKNEFQFASHQLHEAVYGGISPALRIEYHAVVADTIKGEWDGDAPEGRVAFALARHLLAAEQALEAEPFLEPALEHVAARVHPGEAGPFLEKLRRAFSVARPRPRFAIGMQLWAVYELQGRVDDQLGVLEEARALADEIGEAGPRARVHICLGAAYRQKGEFDRLGEEAERGRALAQEAGDKKWESNALHLLGLNSWRAGEFDRCVDRWRRALEIRRELGDRGAEASSLLALAEVLPFVGEGASALAMKRESLEIFREIGHRRGECSILNNLGNSLVDEGQLDEALELFDKSVEIARELGELISEAHPLRNKGRALKILGRIDEAREAFEQALAIFREVGDRAGEFNVLVGLGPTLGEVGEHKEAQRLLEGACALADALDAPSMRSYARRELAVLLHETGKRELAWESFRIAFAQAEATGSERREFEVLHDMGNAALREGDPESAARYLARAAEKAEVAQEAGERLALCHCRLGRALRLGGDESGAAGWFERAEAFVADRGRLGVTFGPEIYFTLRDWTPDAERRGEYLTAAKRLVDTRTKAIRNEAYRLHLTQSWPNPEILEEAARQGA